MLVKIQPPIGTTWLGRRLTLKTSRLIVSLMAMCRQFRGRQYRAWPGFTVRFFSEREIKRQQ